MESTKAPSLAFPEGGDGAMFDTIAWATLPPDNVHQPVWGRTHLVTAGTTVPGTKTLCGKTVPDDLHDWDYGDDDERCQVCLRVLASRK